MSRPIQKGKVYGNCKMFSPDGTLLCRCHADKAEWYLSRGLAFVIEQNPYLSIQLNFEPKGKGYSGEPFYMQDKENHCVVCGSENNLTKHHCVPACFRKRMPQEYKNHTAHDVLPVCADCHEIYEPEAIKLKKEIAERFGIDNVMDNVEWRAWRAANSLVEHGSKLSKKRIKQIHDRLRDFLKKSEFTQEEIEKISKEDPRIKIKNSNQFILSKVEDLDDFIREWRKHFVSVMNPQFLPKYWSVDFRTTKKD